MGLGIDLFFDEFEASSKMLLIFFEFGGRQGLQHPVRANRALPATQKITKINVERAAGFATPGSSGPGVASYKKITK